jgi:hypothetical protein
MKRLLIILLCCISYTATIDAQGILPLTFDTLKNGAIRKEMTLQRARIILQKEYNSKARDAAIKIVMKNVKAGNPEAMHILGMVNYDGFFITRNFEIARKWFEIANRKGYLKSAYNLAMMYRLGIGVTQDFSKAYQYICRAGEAGDSQAVYARGYLLYKGLGCEQSYEEAIKYFKQAAGQGHGYAMYMIGLCYRNGYGVERDNGEAMFWLKRAADNNVKASTDELSTDAPENPIRSTRIRSAGGNSAQGVINPRFKAIRHEMSSAQFLQGSYKGSISTYDWSGQHVIKESLLEVSIELNGNEFIARWKEDTLSTVVAKGILTDTALVFTHATYSKLDHFNPTKPVIWNFTKASLHTVLDSNSVNLAGTLQLYSPETKEPGRPMYLNLRTKEKSSVSINLLTNSNELNTDPLVYPNPFTNLLNLSFYLTTKARCLVEIYSMNGNKVYEEPLGELNMGSHHYQLKLNLSSGNYNVKLKYGDKVFSAVVMKN